jgi:iron complex outermembrane receptor protein
MDQDDGPELNPGWKVNLKNLEKQQLTLMVLKDGQTLFTSGKRGIEPLVDLLETNRDMLIGTTVVDRIVGNAASKLLLWQHVQQIDAKIASRRALGILRHSGIRFNYEELVPELLDSHTGQIDRFELMSIKHDYAELFYRALIEELLIFKSKSVAL